MVDNQLYQAISSSVRKAMLSGQVKVFHRERISRSSLFAKVSSLSRKDVASDSMVVSIAISTSQSPKSV